LDKPDDAMTPNFNIASTPQAQPTVKRARNSVDQRIRAFLNGEGHGEDVLGALYGSVADEPIPARLRNLLKR